MKAIVEANRIDLITQIAPQCALLTGRGTGKFEDNFSEAPDVSRDYHGCPDNRHQYAKDAPER